MSVMRVSIRPGRQVIVERIRFYCSYLRTAFYIIGVRHTSAFMSRQSFHISVQIREVTDVRRQSVHPSR